MGAAAIPLIITAVGAGASMYMQSKAADNAKEAADQQAAVAAKQKAAEKAKEDQMNRQRMADMRSRIGGGFGDEGGGDNSPLG